ncbi:MAG: hypothetical protein JWR09_4885 [Mucilaginibacter sp.]|nr:hypothetical protein [Mucilaginibacter sp.]
MNGVNFLAIVTAAFVVFVVSGLWYSPLLFGRQWLALRGIDPNTLNKQKMTAGKMIGEIARVLIIASVLSHFVTLLGVNSILGALNLALWIWVGFYAIILAGSVIHDQVPWKLAAIHAGDGLARIVLITIIISIWR